MRVDIPLVKHILTLCLAKRLRFSTQILIMRNQFHASMPLNPGTHPNTSPKGWRRLPPVQTKPSTGCKVMLPVSMKLIWLIQKMIQSQNQTRTMERKTRSVLFYLDADGWLWQTWHQTKGGQQRNPTKDLCLCGKEGQGTHPDKKTLVKGWFCKFCL